MTVGLPVYNGMPFLPESVESILAQTYREFELLIIDDGSTDQTATYLRTLHDPRIRIIHQEHQGLTSTLNRMLADISTPWLIRHDADDVALPHRLARLAAAIRERPGAAMFYTHAQHYQDGNKLGMLRTTEGSPAELREITRSGYLLAICHPTAALNVQLVQGVGGYRFDLFVEDTDLWWRLALRHDIVFLPDTTLLYRMHSESTCGRNFYTHAVNTLFVQYLLLSELRQRQANPYEEIIKPVGELMDRRTLTLRKDLREATIALGENRYLDAAVHGLRGFATAPLPFLRRVAHGARPGRIYRLGESPSRFEAIAQQIWPRNQERVLEPDSKVLCDSYSSKTL